MDSKNRGLGIWRWVFSVWMVLVLGVTHFTPVEASARLTPEALRTFFDATLTEQLAEEHLVGATVAVVQGDALLFAQGYGYADLEAARPVEAGRTLFYIGSDGKLFTWTAVMQLAEQGKLDLHADVNAYLDFKIPATFAEPVTLHHLMTHTGGFEEQLEALFVADEADVRPLREFLVRTLPRRVYPPGVVFAYSNYGTALAGYIIERVSGERYADYITAHVLQPLGMTRSAATQPLSASLAPDVALGYHYRNGSYDALAFEWVAAPPCAIVRSTATDIAHFMSAHLNGGCVEGACILQAGTLDEMHRQQFTHHPALAGMAYGFVESRFNGQRVLWHLGESARFVTLLALLPETGVGVFVSYNTPPVDGRAILFRFLDAFYPVERAPVEPQPAPDWATRAAVVGGTYIPARSAHSSAQKLVTWLEALPVNVAAEGDVALGPQRYVETAPWLFQQRDGDRALTFRQEDNRTWLFWGPFAYFKLRWYETPLLHLGLWATSALLFAGGWIGWPIAAWRNRRCGRPAEARLARQVRLARWLAAGLGLLVYGLLAWFTVLMLAFGGDYVYPAATIAFLTRLLWLAVPLTLAVVFLAARAWFRREMAWGWRVHYSLIALASAALLWSLHFWNLLTF